MNPLLRTFVEQSPDDQLTELLDTMISSVPFGTGIDDTEAWAAVRSAVLDPGPGDAPSAALRECLATRSLDQATRMSVHLFHMKDDHPHPGFWIGVSTEVATAAPGHVPGPPLATS